MYEKIKLSKEDMEVLDFIKKYKMLKVADAELIYKTKRYYRQRVNKLIENEFVKRYKSYIILDKKGRKALNAQYSLYIKNINNDAYMERLKNISSIASLTIDSKIEFIPSWDLKEKYKYTDIARRYIGKLKLNDVDYLVYYISEKKQHVYIQQLIYDIHKTVNYNNIIVFVDSYDICNSKYSNFSFGKKNTFVIQNIQNNRNLLKEIENINYHEVLEELYDEEILISDWDKADYMLDNGTYIVNMPFINAERISRLNWFFSENKSEKIVYIVTYERNKEQIKKMITNKNCFVSLFKEEDDDK